MLFFQVALTGGYAYSNWLVKLRRNKTQAIIHLILMGISVCLVTYLWIIWPSPVTPATSWRPDSVAYPVFYIFFRTGYQRWSPVFCPIDEQPSDAILV